jgi:hypothetical protein
MRNSTKFIVENDCKSDLKVWVEPEAHPVTLSPGEEVIVHDEFQNSPVTVRVSRDDAGFPMLSIWPGDGETIVEKNGHNVLRRSGTRGS